MLLCKRSDFVAISAGGHGAPAAAARTGLVAEKQTAAGIGADPQTGLLALGDDFSGGARHRGKQPVEAAFAGDKVHLPFSVRQNELVVSFGDAEQLVHRFHPLGSKLAFVDDGAENVLQGGRHLLRLLEQSVRGLRIDVWKIEKLRTARHRDDLRYFQEADEAGPRKLSGILSGIGEVHSQAAADQR